MRARRVSGFVAIVMAAMIVWGGGAVLRAQQGAPPAKNPFAAADEKILAEVQSGEFANQWIGENKAGRKKFLAMREAATNQPIETVGRELREMMTFLKKRKEAGVP